jgi:aldose 1-epimerase
MAPIVSHGSCHYKLIEKGSLVMAAITAKPLFQKPEGTATLYTLQNTNGIRVSITNYGATILSIWVPDRNGKLADVVLGHGSTEMLCQQCYYLGATVGRCCNRISKGQFTLNGRDYQLACNDHGKNHLHGGIGGFARRFWQAQTLENGSLRMSLHSPDGEDGYPGNLEVSVVFTLTENDQLQLHYQAQGDADTLCSLTNHTYFNLAGHDAGDILKHKLKLYADRFTETNAESIPTGRELPVAGTSMDFTDFHAIGERIHAADQPLKFGNGYDHNWVLRDGDGQLALCAELYEPESGRLLQVSTDLPGIQFYSGNFIDGSACGKGGVYYQPRSGLALETQYAPDAVNHPQWPSPILRAGEQFDKTTIFAFSVR